MPRIPEYPEVTANGLDTNDKLVMDIDGVTKYIQKDELKKAIDRLEIVAPSGDYTLALTDEGKYMRVDGDVTVPANASVAWPIGAAVTIRNTSASDIEIIADSGVTFNGTTTTVPADASIVLAKIGTNIWDIVGGGAGGGSGTTVNVAYSTTIPFTSLSIKMAEHTITGSATFVPNTSGAVANSFVTLRLITDGDVSHVQDFSAFKKTSGSEDIDNSVASMLYLIQFLYDGYAGGYWMSILQEDGALPVDTTAPTIIGATIEDAHPDSIDIQFSETVSTTLPAASTIDATGSVTGAQTSSALTRPLADTVRAQFPLDWVTGETVTFDYVQGGTSSDIADLSGNKLANVTAHAVTNNLSSDLMQFVPANWTTAAGGYVGHSNVEGENTAYSTQPIGVGEYFICRDAPGNSGSVEGWFGLSDTPIDAQGAVYINHPLLLGTDFNVYKNGAVNIGAYTRGDYFKFTNEAGEYKIYKSSDGVTYSLIGTFGTLTGDWYFGVSLGNNEAVESLSRG